MVEKAAVYHRLGALGAAGKVCCGMMRALFYGGMITAFFYSLFALLLPLILLFMAWQGRKNKGWRQRWSDVLAGWCTGRGPGLWIHGVSGRLAAAAGAGLPSGIRPFR